MIQQTIQGECCISSRFWFFFFKTILKEFFVWLISDFVKKSLKCKVYYNLHRKAESMSFMYDYFIDNIKDYG